jgi:hypothetical protein
MAPLQGPLCFWRWSLQGISDAGDALNVKLSTSNSQRQAGRRELFRDALFVFLAEELAGSAFAGLVFGGLSSMCRSHVADRRDRQKSSSSESNCKSECQCAHFSLPEIRRFNRPMFAFARAQSFSRSLVKRPLECLLRSSLANSEPTKHPPKRFRSSEQNLLVCNAFLSCDVFL